MSGLVGRRVHTTDWRSGHGTKAGDYGFVDLDNPPGTEELTGQLWFRDPNGTIGRVTTHTVTVHEDGSVSVEPSIAGADWHGWLRRGVWSW